LYLCWIFSFLSSLPQLFVYEVLEHPKDKTFKQCATFAKLNSFWLKLVYGLYNLMSLYGFPLIIMIFCYFKIFLIINNKKPSVKYSPMNLRSKFNHNYFSKEMTINQKHFEKMRQKTLRMSALFGK
jgi:hypothetical protein